MRTAFIRANGSRRVAGRSGTLLYSGIGGGGCRIASTTHLNGAKTQQRAQTHIAQRVRRLTLRDEHAAGAAPHARLHFRERLHSETAPCTAQSVRLRVFNARGAKLDRQISQRRYELFEGGRDVPLRLTRFTDSKLACGQMHPPAFAKVRRAYLATLGHQTMTVSRHSNC